MPRRKNNDSDSPHQSASYSGVPFRDATPGTDEIPLEEIDSWIVPARDEKGTSERIHFQAPPYLSHAVDVILRSGRFPYARPADFHRHAAVRHLRFCTGIRASIPQHVLIALESILEMCRDAEMRRSVENTFDRFEDAINFYLGRGDHMEVIRLVQLAKMRLNGLHPGAWQRLAVEKYQNKYSSLLRPDGTEVGVGKPRGKGKSNSEHTESDGVQ